MKLKNTIKNSLFIKSFNLVKSNPSKIGLMILFDVLFLVSLFGFRTLSGYFAQGIVATQALASALFFIILSLIYYLIILVAYSFFKYSILDFIKSLFEMSEMHRHASERSELAHKSGISKHTQKSSIFDESEFSFKRLGQFYLLNIVIAAIFFPILILFTYIFLSVKAPYKPFIFVFLAVPYALFLYIVANISHSLFYEGSSIKETIKKSFKITFTKMKMYRETILIIILVALLLWLLFFGSGYLIRLIASKNYSLYLTAYSYFKQISIIILDLVLYFVILINRISFYSLARDIK